MSMTSTARRPASVAPASRVAPPRRTVMASLSRFFRTPKGTVLWLLSGLVFFAWLRLGHKVLPGLEAAVLTATALDAFIGRYATGRWTFPDGGLLSGMFVAMVLAPQAPGYVAPLTAALAVASKHALRTRWSNVFNPAALALVVAALVFPAGQSWWGALPDLSIVGFLLVLAAGWYLVVKIKKLPLVLSFLGTALLIFTVAAFAGNARQVAEIFRAPDIEAMLFFACFMLTDPPTSPAKQPDQVWFGVAVAAASATAFLALGALWFLAGGLLVGNALESLRRVVVAARRQGQRPQASAAL